MNNFGELAHGEIPEPLKYSRPFESTTLSNGIRVCTEKSLAPVAGVGVFIKAGSRNETLETSGASFLTSRMALHGTESRSGADISRDLSNAGAQLDTHADREYTRYQVQVFKNDVGKAVELLGDIVNNPAHNAAQFEAEKEVVSNIHEGNIHEYERTTLENAHYNSFRDHIMGQPTRGDRDNLQNLTIGDIQKFHSENYHGDNIVIVGTGNVSHQELVDQVEAHFGGVAQRPQNDAGASNGGKAVYTPSLLMVRDDEMINSNVGVFYNAPHWGHKDFAAFWLLKSVFGEYNVMDHTEHLNDCLKQYNSLHAMLGDLPDVTIHRSHYLPYSDSGLFGHYFFGNEVFTRQMTYSGMVMNTIYSHYLNEVEIYRGRNNLYNALMDKETVAGNLNEIGK